MTISWAHRCNAYRQPTILFLAMVLCVALPAWAQQKPFTRDQVQGLVRDGLGDESGAKLIELRGISFAPAEDFIQSLKAAGASETFLKALRATKPSKPASVKKQPVHSTDAVQELGIPPRGEYSHSGEITETDCDKFEEYCTTTLDGVFLADGLKLSAFFVYQPPKLRTPPKTITIRLTRSGEDWEYLKCNDLTFLLDGRFKLPVDSKYDGDVLPSGGVIEFIVVNLPRADFLRIALAKKVELKLCITEAELSDDDQRALLDLASRMNP
jgi:hypothetical protein